MYGDCHVVVSNMSGGDGVHPSDSFFSSQMQNPNFNFLSNMPFNVFTPIIPVCSSIFTSLLGTNIFTCIFLIFPLNSRKNKLNFTFERRSRENIKNTYRHNALFYIYSQKKESHLQNY